MADIIIRNATIIDGTGAERFAGDVAVDDGHITEVGDVSGSATEEVDATGLVLAPGFVDVHTHDDGALLLHPDMEFKVSQGCTSVVVEIAASRLSQLYPGSPLWTYLGCEQNGAISTDIART